MRTLWHYLKIILTEIILGQNENLALKLYKFTCIWTVNGFGVFNTTIYGV